jgi:hypothetical protein
VSDSGEIACPDLRGVVAPTSSAAAEILQRLRATGLPVRAGSIDVQPARGFDIASRLAKRCGPDSIRYSRWVHACTNDQSHCTVATDIAPGLAADYLMLKTDGRWHAWYWLPGGDPNPVP